MTMRSYLSSSLTLANTIDQTMVSIPSNKQIQITFQTFTNTRIIFSVDYSNVFRESSYAMNVHSNMDFC
jgi:hypothetical protein